MLRIVNHGNELYQYLPDSGSHTKVAVSNVVSAVAKATLRVNLCLTTSTLSPVAKDLLSQLFKLVPEAKLGELVRVSGIPTGTLTGTSRATRPLVGPTRAVFQFLLSPTPAKLKRHPAGPVVEFIGAGGANRAALSRFVCQLGDMAIPYLLARDNQTNNPEVESSPDLLADMLESWNPYLTRLRMSQQAEQYCILGKGTSAWIDAVCNGKDLSNPDTNWIATAMAQTGLGHTPGGVHLTCTTLLRLLVGQWAATEYHPELLNPYVFSSKKPGKFVYECYSRSRQCGSKGGDGKAEV